MTDTTFDITRVFTSLMLVTFGAGCGAPIVETTRPQANVVNRVLHIGPAGELPALDGRINDICWRNATMTSGFTTVEGNWSQPQTTVFLTNDDENLYIAIKCNEPDVASIKADTDTHDAGAIFSDDHVELFLDTNRDGRTYYHLAANTRGARYDANCTIVDGQLDRDEDANPAWEAVAHVESDHWSIELRLPFRSLGTDEPVLGTVWGINITRSRRAGDSYDENSWANLSGGFNQPKLFARAIFGDRAPLSYAINTIEKSLSESRIRMTLRNGTNEPQDIKTRWIVSSLRARRAHATVSVRLQPNGQQEIGVAVKSGKDSGDDVAVGHTQLSDTTLLIWSATDRQQREQIHATLAFPAPIQMSLDQYFYSSDESSFEIRLSNMLESGNHYLVDVAMDPDTQPIASERVVIEPGRTEQRVSFDASNWPEGRFVVSASVFDRFGHRLESVHRVFFRQQAMSAKIPPSDAQVSLGANGIILLDGAPFFPFLTTPLSTAPAFVKHCFNMRFVGGDRGLVVDPMERIGVGLPWVTRERGKTFILLPEENEMFSKVRSIVEENRANPHLLYWILKYESQIPMYRDDAGGQRIRLHNPDVLKQVDRYIKEIDQDHPTVLQVEWGAEDMSAYAEAVDMVEVATGSSYAKRMIPRFIENLEKIRPAVGNKPLIIWIGSSIPNPKYRTAEEIRCASYLALTHGAAGIIFHMGHGGVDERYSRHWSVYPGLAREVERLFPIVTAPQSDRRPRVTVDGDGIDYCVRAYEGDTYLIATNTKPYRVNGSIRIHDNGWGLRQVSLPLENRQIRPVAGRFTDVFTAFEPHVYVWSNE